MNFPINPFGDAPSFVAKAFEGPAQVDLFAYANEVVESTVAELAKTGILQSALEPTMEKFNVLQALFSEADVAGHGPKLLTQLVGAAVSGCEAGLKARRFASEEGYVQPVADLAAAKVLLEIGIPHFLMNFVEGKEPLDVVGQVTEDFSARLMAEAREAIEEMPPEVRGQVIPYELREMFEEAYSRFKKGERGETPISVDDLKELRRLYEDETAQGYKPAEASSRLLPVLFDQTIQKATFALASLGEDLPESDVRRGADTMQQSGVLVRSAIRELRKLAPELQATTFAVSRAVRESLPSAWAVALGGYEQGYEKMALAGAKSFIGQAIPLFFHTLVEQMSKGARRDDGLESERQGQLVLDLSGFGSAPSAPPLLPRKPIFENGG